MSEITPNKIPENAILSYAQMGNPMFEFKIEQRHNDFYLMLVVDCEKMDKNSGKFDKKYRDELVNDYRPIEKIEYIAEEIKKFFDVKLRVSFNFKNYKYLDQIEHKIQRAIKQTSRPEVNVVISAEGDNPVVRFGLYDHKNTWKEKDKIKFVDELQKVLGSEINLESYRWFTTSGQK